MFEKLTFLLICFFFLELIIQQMKYFHALNVT